MRAMWSPDELESRLGLVEGGYEAVDLIRIRLFAVPPAQPGRVVGLELVAESEFLVPVEHLFEVAQGPVQIAELVACERDVELRDRHLLEVPVFAQQLD